MSRDFTLARLYRAVAHRFQHLTEDERDALHRYAQDAYLAGIRAVENERAIAPPAPRHHEDSRARRWFARGLELAASGTTLAGMWFGSTTLVGDAWYLASTLIWCVLTTVRRLHGIWPLNIAALVVEALNFMRAGG